MLATVLQIAAMICGIATAVVIAVAFRSSWPDLSAITAGVVTIGSFGGMGFAGVKLTATSLTEDGSLLPRAIETWEAVLAACDNYDEDEGTSAIGCSDPFHNN